MISASVLVSLFDYSRHASKTLVGAAKELTEEELTRDLRSSHQSILGTLTHTYLADRLWLSRFEGPARTTLTDPGEQLSLGDLEREWTPLIERFKTYIGSIGDDGVIQTFTFRNLAGKEFTMPRWQCLLHVVNHGSIHRGQVVTMLRQVGRIPPNTDLLYYYGR